MNRQDRCAANVACVLMGLLPVAAWFAPNADAEPLNVYADNVSGVVCETLEADPTFHGVEKIIEALHDAGHITYYDAGRVVRYAVDQYCPESFGLIMAWANSANPTDTYVAGRMTGILK